MDTPEAAATPAAEPAAAPLLLNSEEVPAADAAPEATAAPAEAAAETQPPAESETPAPGDPPPDLRKNFAAIAREAKALRAEKEALKAAKAELEQARQMRELAKTDPVAALSALGLSYEQITDHILGQGKTADPVATLAAQVEELKNERAKEREDRERDQKTAAQRENEQRALAFVNQQLDAGGDKYECIRAEGAEAEVLKLAEMRMEQDGVTAEDFTDQSEFIAAAKRYVDEAAADCEKHLAESIEQKLRKLKRFASLTAAQPATAPSSAPTSPRAATGSVTLTNRSASQAPPAPVDEAALLRDPDRRDALIQQRVGSFFT